MVLGPAGPGTHSAELHQMSGQRNETDNEEGRDGDEKKSDCGEGNKAKKEKNTKGKQLGEFRLDKKKAMRTQKGARERTEEMKLAQALLNTACA